MPRVADPTLPERLLDGAEKLWRAGGEEAVTIRGVADAAGSSTPTLYSYYADREMLMIALRSRVHRRFITFMSASKSFTDSCERYLAYGENHEREYGLLYGYRWFQRAPVELRNAEFSDFEARLRARKIPKNRSRSLAWAVLTVLHGAVMYRTAQRTPGSEWREIRAAALKACGVLFADASPGRKTRSTSNLYRERSAKSQPSYTG